MSLSRTSLFSVLLLFVRPATVPAADTQSGTVLDPSGRAVSRAYVRALDPAGAQLAAGFADQTGRFHLTTTSTNCTVEATLTGFQPATVPCGTESLRIVLALAPIEETVVVTATNTEAPSDQIGASVTTFTAADIDARREGLVADLLRTSPGAMVIRTGAPGGQASLFVRGGESSYNKVLLDGIPLNEPGGTFNFSNLTADNLERIEIVRGAQSALFGSDAMASVVQLFTKRADRLDPKPHASVAFEGGTFNTMKTNAAVSGLLGKLDYELGASRFTTDNEAANNKFRDTSLSGNVGLALNQGTTLRVIGRGEFGRAGTPGPTAFGRPDLDAFFDRHDGMMGATFDQQLTSSFRQRATYSLAIANQESADLIVDPTFTPTFEGQVASFPSSDFTYDSLTNLHRHHASYQADWRLPRLAHADHLSSFLVDWDGERVHLTDRLATAESRASRNNFGFAVEHQALWSRVFVTIGARAEHNDSFGTTVVPRGSVVAILHPGRGAFGETRLRADAGLGIKEPTVLQSFSISPYFLGNLDLKPERSQTAEIGIDQRLAKDRVKVEVTAFMNRFRNLISLKTTDPVQSFSQYANIGKTRANGAEFGLEIAPTRALHARGGYTFLASDVVESTSTDPIFAQGALLFRRPKHSAYVGATLAVDRFTIDVSGVILGKYVDSDFGTFPTPITTNPGYRSWDARVSCRISRQLTAIASFDNVADTRHMEPTGYPALGRAARLGVKVGF